MGGEIIQKTVQTTIKSVVTIPYHADTLLIYAVVGACAVIALTETLKIPIIETVLWVSLGMGLLVSSALSPGYDSMFANIAFKLAIGMVGFFLFRKIRDYDRLYSWLKVTALLMTVSMIIFLMMGGGIDTETSEYSMYYGYLLLPSVVISANESIKHKTPIHFVNLAVGLITTVAMGARGPIVCEIAFILVVLVFHKTSPRKKFLELATASAITVIVYKYFYEILAAMNVWFAGMGLSTRAIVKIQRGVFFESLGRNSIRDISFNTINEHLMTGVGLGRDRIIIANGLFVPKEEAIGCYPHNLFLEIIMQFGVVIGLLLIVSLVVFIALPIIAKKINEQTMSLYMILIAVGLFPLMVSGSYLSTPAFFYILGFGLSVMKNQTIPLRETFLTRIDSGRLRTVE